MLEKEKILPLTHAQKRIWYTEQLYPNTSINNICSTLLFQDIIDLKLLKTVINNIIYSHDAIRIRITDFEVPNNVKAGEQFTINITIRNDRFLPARLMLQVDLMDGMLDLIKKDIGDEVTLRCPGRTIKIIQVNCGI